MEQKEMSNCDLAGEEANQSEILAIGAKNNTQISIQNKYNVPQLKEIIETENSSQSKLERAKIKANEFVQNLEETVQYYLQKAGIEDFSVDPEIKQMQIKNATKQLMKIAKYLTKEIIDNEDTVNEKATYIEILESTRDSIKGTLDEGIDFSNL